MTSVSDIPEAPERPESPERRPRRWLWLAVALAAVLLLLIAAAMALRGGGEDDPNKAAAIQAVNKFAAAEDADACEMLTEAAIERLYGTPQRCARQAGQFRSGAVKVEDVLINPDGRRAIAHARTVAGDDRFTVTLVREFKPGCACAPGGDWLIGEVQPK